MTVNLEPVFQWIQTSAASRVIRSSNVVIDGIETVHLFGLCLLGGTVLRVDLSPMGLGFRRQPVAGIAQDLAPWTRRGLTLMFITGPLLFISESLKAYDRPWFWIKMSILAAALIFHFGMQQPVALAEPPVSRGRASAVGVASLALWIGVALAAKIFAA
jgi:hypothetical protein